MPSPPAPSRRPGPGGVQLSWHHRQLDPSAVGPTGLGLDRGPADYLVVTNTGDGEATALTLVAIPLNGSPIALRDAPEPLDLPAGRTASWALIHTAAVTGRACAMSVAAYWFENDQERSGHWGVPIDGRW